MLAQLYFNAEAYIGEEHFDECAQICRDIIGGLYGVYELDDTWYGPHTFDNDSSHEAIWNVPSENSKVEWSWYFKYFYHNSSYVYFDIETAGYNGFILTPSLNPQGSYYTQWKLGSPYRKFNDKDLRKKPYRYLGNKRYEGMFLVGKQVNFDDPTKVCLGQKEYSGKVIDMVDQVWAQTSKRIPTGVLNDVLNDATADLQPPATNGRRLKIYYITQQSACPPTFILFVNEEALMHFAYQRYLENYFRKTFDFTGTPIRFILREKTKEEK